MQPRRRRAVGVDGEQSNATNTPLLACFDNINIASTILHRAERAVYSCAFKCYSCILIDTYRKHVCCLSWPGHY